MRRFLEVLAVYFAVVLLVPPVEAGCFRRCKPRPVATVRYAPVQARPVYAQPQAIHPTPQAAPMAAGAPSFSGGFIHDLNALRARYGLPAVAEDTNLAAWAGANNAQQAARGMGHYVMGPARRQNVAWTPNGAAPLGMWEKSPPHRAALLDPSIRSIGLAASWPFWTFNAQ